MADLRYAPTVEIYDQSQLKLDLAEVEPLIVALFRKRPEVSRVLLTALPGSSVGMSTISLLLAHAFTADNALQNPIAVRIGPRATIAREQANYNSYVQPYLGFEHGSLRLDAEGPRLSALGYEYLSRSDTPIRTLRDFLAFESDQPAAIDALNVLLTDTIGRPQGAQLVQAASDSRPPGNGWFSDARPYPCQRPRWFYNLVLPSTLTLRDVRAATAADTDETVADLLRAADRPAALGLPDRHLAVGSGATFTLAPAEEEEETKESGLTLVRCLLREGPAPGGGIHRPFDPVAARLDLEVAPDQLAAVRAALAAGRPIAGTIVATRYGNLHRRIVEHQLRPQSQQAGQPLALGSQVIADPLARYADLLDGETTLHTCIVHGDFNLGNILLRRQGSQNDRRPDAWLIDFDRTRPGGHAVYDFIKLETEYKVHILPYRLRSAEDFLRLERALHTALFNTAAVDEILREDAELTQAYTFLAAVRRWALFGLPGARPSPAEYYLGLLANSLATLKYRNLYKEGKDRWLHREARVEPPARAAYLSAAYTASVLDDVLTLAATDASYLPVQQRALPPRPSLVGRDRLVHQVEDYLQERGPVAVIHGPLGSGRDAVANSVQIGLQRAGYLPATVSGEDQADYESAIVAVIETILIKLEVQQVRDLPAVPEALPALTPARRNSQIQLVAQGLARALEADQRRFVLGFRLRAGERDLERFALELARALRRSALVLVADDRLAGLPGEAQFAVKPLSIEALQAYARGQQLLIDDEKLKRVHEISKGLPVMALHLMQLLAQQAGPGRQVLDLSSLPLTTIQSQFARNLLNELPADVRGVAEVAALLQAHGSPADDLDLMLTRTGRASAALRIYTAQVAPLLPLLGPPLLEGLGGSYRALCRQIADAYADLPGALPTRLARYWAEAGEWPQVEAALGAVMGAPDRAYRLSREQILKLTKALLKSGQAQAQADLQALAGDSAAYLSDYTTAAEHYHQALTLLAPGDPGRAPLVARLLDVYQAAGLTPQADEMAALLAAEAGPSSPLQALALAHQGYRAMLESRFAVAEAAFSGAVEQLDATRDAWGADRPVYEEQHVRLSDMLARLEIMQGRYTVAIQRLALARTIAQQQIGDQALLAMLDNDLGIAYFRRGQAGDRSQARACFERSFEQRKRLEDRIGQLRTGQNRAIILTENADGEAQWKEAEALYSELDALVPQVQDYDATQIYANRLELMARWGKLDRAREDIARLLAQPSPSAFVRCRAAINQSQIEMLRGDWLAAAATLAGLADLLAGPEADTDQRRDWAWMCLELELRGGPDCDRGQVAAALGEAPDAADSLADAAFWHVARGLFDLAEGAAGQAEAHLARGAELLKQGEYHFLTAIARTWLAVAQGRAGSPQARATLQSAIAALSPFGETPALGLARGWLTSIEGA